MRSFWTFVAVLGCLDLTGPGPWEACGAGPPQGGAALRLAVKDLGPLGTGSNMFRTGLAHSSGAVFVGRCTRFPSVVDRAPEVFRPLRVGGRGTADRVGR